MMKWIYSFGCGIGVALAFAYYMMCGPDWAYTHSLSDRELVTLAQKYDCDHPAPDTACECAGIRREQQRRCWLAWVGYGRRIPSAQ